MYNSIVYIYMNIDDIIYIPFLVQFLQAWMQALGITADTEKIVRNAKIKFCINVY